MVDDIFRKSQPYFWGFVCVFNPSENGGFIRNYITNPQNMEEQLGFNRCCNQPKWWIMVDLTNPKNIWRTSWDLTNQKWSKLGLNKQQE